MVLSRKEVAEFFAAIKSPMYRLILILTYATGMRVSEVVHLRMSDIDSDRMTIRVVQGKGKKDPGQDCWPANAPIPAWFRWSSFPAPWS